MRISKESICEERDVRAYARKLGSGASSSLTPRVLPPDRDYNCTKLIDVTCEGWSITFFLSRIDVEEGKDFVKSTKVLLLMRQSGFLHLKKAAACTADWFYRIKVMAIHHEYYVADAC